MKIKTIWHWKEIIKSFAILLIATTLWVFLVIILDIHIALCAIGGFVVGWASMAFSLVK